MTSRSVETKEDYHFRKELIRFIGILTIISIPAALVIAPVLLNADFQAFANKAASFFPLGR